MGQIADDMRNGTMCQSCGALNDALVAHFEKEAPGGGDVYAPWEPPGHPITCAACKRENAQVRKLATR